MDLATLLVTLLLLTIWFLILYARWNYGTLEAMGVPVLKPWFLFGSIPALHRRVTHEEDLKHFKELGPIYGVYEGKTPVLYVSDPDIIRRITVTEAKSFRERREMDFGNPFFNEMFDFLPYEKWKIVRSTLMPAFSASNINCCKAEWDLCIAEFLGRLDTLERTDGALVDLRSEFSGYIASISAMNMFGLRLDKPYNISNMFRVAAEEAIGQEVEYSALYSMSLTFPWLTKIAPTYSSVKNLKKLVDFALSQSIASASPPTAFIQRMRLLLDKGKSADCKHLGITEVTAFSQAMVLYIVSYEVLTAALVFLTYFLAHNPESQARLHEELSEYFGSQEKKELPFLKACIEETLRLVPVQRRIERKCVQDCELNDLKFKKGLVIMVPLFAAHRNPAYIQDPELFRPERFLPENKRGLEPYALASFGHGPRNCGGQRYAMDILMKSAAEIFHKFKFKVCSKTELRFKPGRMFLAQHYPIYMSVERIAK